MSTSAGTGSPVFFKCARLSREYYLNRYPNRHAWTSTGKIRRGRRGGVRMITTHMEYTCKCGHVGWTRHSDMAMLYRSKFNKEPGE